MKTTEMQHVSEISELPRITERMLNRSIKVSQSDVAAEAETLLGFKRRDASPLLVALKELDIQPLNAEQVAEYKKSKQTRRKSTSSNRWETTTIRQVWEPVKLADYSNDIPIAILSKAVSIKKLVPEVEFEVETLVEKRNKKVTKRLPDPFLVAIFGVRRVYIDVWLEPEFETKLYA